MNLFRPGFRASGARRALSLLAVASFVAGASSAQETVVTGASDHVAVHAVDAPLSEVLASLVALVPDATLFIDPELERLPVTVDVEKTSLFDAVGRILSELDVDFAIVGGTGVHPLRLYAGELADVVPYNGPTSSGDAFTGASRADALSARRELRAERARDQEETGEVGVPPMVDTPGASDTLVTKDFTMVGESVTYNDPNFVPYKLSEAAKKARQSIDLSKIP